ncbi:FtsX-like permease family protein [Luteibacter sp. UNCMF331Sha3.1]|uniref:ABC transporter permease n=1 Tax=Luteibacter sp. UNCMF331Sha3.1 TaxID=1502760 RepID=UPI000B7E6170|nr:FtsX-like permease family protein [Luteibacter sp. UNCMF331Sha3.1]
MNNVLFGRVLFVALHSLSIAKHSLRRRLASAALIVATIAIGVGGFCATGSGIAVLGADPLGGRGAGIYHPQLDSTSSTVDASMTEPPDDLNFLDAQSVFRLAEGSPRVMTSQNWLPLTGKGDVGALARMAITRATTRDFFSMFGARMQYGAPWTDAQDSLRDRVVVLSSKANDAIFGGTDSVGRELTIATKTMRVVGVLKPWDIVPKIYDLNDGPYSDSEELFIPFSTWVDLPQDYGFGPVRCIGPLSEDAYGPMDDHCTWVQVWVAMNPAKASLFREKLIAYSLEQQRSGRYGRPPNTRLRNVPEWLRYKNVVPPGVRAQFFVSLGVLLACLFTVAGLQVVSFRGRFPELGLRRALGASRRAIILQLVIEAGLLGFLGGLFGIALGFIGVGLLRLSPETYASHLSLDGGVVAASIMLGIAAMLVSSLVPAIVASGHSPYRQMQEAG